MEEALKESEILWEEIFEYVPMGIGLATFEGQILSCNNVMCQMTGCSREELKKINLKDACQNPESSTLLLECLKKEGLVRNFEVKLKRKDGTIYIASLTLVPFSLNGKKVFLTVAVDITESKRTEEALRESEMRFRDIVNLLPLIVFETDKNGNFTFKNRLGYKSSGYAEEDIDKGLNVLQLFVPEDRDRVKKNILKTLNRENFSGHEYTALRKDGSTFPVILYSAPIIHEKKPVGLRGAVIDVTERKKMEEEKEKLQAQLVRSEKMAGIGTLASGITHEFNNLLQIIRGHTEFAMKTKKVKDMEEALDKVKDASDRVAKIIKDLVIFSKKEESEEVSFDITEIIESVLSLIENHIKKHNICVVRKYKKRPRINVNKEKIHQVFLNLVTNARDAMIPKGGKLEIIVDRDKENVEVSISDTGKGIEKKNIDKVFEPFYTTKGAIGGDDMLQGSGLGLSVSYGIVHRHRGTIDVKSEVGKGTTFKVKLPVKGKKRKRIANSKKTMPLILLNS